MRFELTATAESGCRQLPAFGHLVAPSGEQLAVEFVGGSVGPYERASWSFVSCLDGAKITIGHEDGYAYESVSAQALYDETGIEADTVGHRSRFPGAWFTRQRRSAVMRGLAGLCTERWIAVGREEIQAILLNREPGFCSPRANATREFGDKVADEVEAGGELGQAIRDRLGYDLGQALRWPAMSQTFAQTLVESLTVPSVQLRIGEVRVDELRRAAGWDVLLAEAEEAVAAAREEIEAEIVAAHDGQMALV
jgi:hypothetical protein